MGGRIPGFLSGLKKRYLYSLHVTAYYEKSQFLKNPYHSPLKPELGYIVQKRAIVTYNKDSNFLDVLKSIFPDAHNLSSVGIKLLTRTKSEGVDLRSVDFLGRVEDSAALGTIDSFVRDSLILTFECKYGKIIVSNTKEECLHFHPLELLELTRTDQIDFIMTLKERFNADILFPIKEVNKVNIFSVPKSEI